MTKEDLLALPNAVRSFNGFYTVRGKLTMENSIHILVAMVVQVLTAVLALVWILVRHVRGKRTRRLIGAVAMTAMVFYLLYAPCLAGGCAMVHTVVSTEISAPPDVVAALYADYEGWPRLFPATFAACDSSPMMVSTRPSRS